MIERLLAWFGDPATWSGSSGVPVRIAEHLGYSVVVVLVASLLAIPLGLVIGHTGRGKWLVSSANAARAVPSLGLLFAFALWLGPLIEGDLVFVLPSIIVLVILAMPPLLSGAYAGVEAVDPSARDAARGVGMTPSQVLLGVELPCAMPLLLSGLRSATLQVIATATIASYISLGGLGRFLIDGLAAGDYAQMAGGALLVALVALAVDGVLSLLTRLVVSPGLRETGGRRRDRRSRSATAGSPETATDRDDDDHMAGAASTAGATPTHRQSPTGRKATS